MAARTAAPSPGVVTVDEHDADVDEAPPRNLRRRMIAVDHISFEKMGGKMMRISLLLAALQGRMMPSHSTTLQQIQPKEEIELSQPTSSTRSVDSVGEDHYHYYTFSSFLKT